MLLDQLLDQPGESPVVLFRPEPYGVESREQMIREIIGLANSDADVARYIVFGVDAGNGQNRLVGLDERQLEMLREDHRAAGQLIEPELQLAPIHGEFDGKRIVALEIDGCTDPPYVVREDITARLRRGECWIRTGANLRPAQRGDLDDMYARKRAIRKPPVCVGFGEEPEQGYLEIAIPDASNPPSREALQKIAQAIKAKRAAQQILGRDDTALARLAHARLYGAEVPFESHGIETLVEDLNSAAADYHDADQHYFFELRAVRLQLSIQNIRANVLRGAAIELSLPRATGFDVAERLLADPKGGASTMELSLLGYPDVAKTDSAVRVRASLGDLGPGISRPVFETPLRIAVGTKMRGRKVAIRYTVVAEGLAEPVRGRLRIRFER